jgi:Domain of unknown function (DU1801)
MAKRSTSGSGEAVKQVDGFLAKFEPEIEKAARMCLKKMRARLPGAFELVYDNYNALAFGFGPSERAGEAIFSIAVFPRWVSLFFLQGAKLADPHKILKGGGNKVRHIVLKSAADLDLPEIRELFDRARLDAKKDIDSKGGGTLIVKSVAEKQRPRRAAVKS